MGKLLYQELSESLVKVEYVLDKDTSKEFGAGIKVYYPSRQLEKPDAVIVTAEFYFKEISDELKSLGYKNIYSISEVIGWTK